MVTGRVDARGEILQPFVELAVYGSSDRMARVQAIIDTGFTEYLTLPPHAIDALGLTKIMEEPMTLANGVPFTFEVYSGEIDWDNQKRRVDVHQKEGDPLIGMAMLRDHDLRIRVVPNGPVGIDPID